MFKNLSSELLGTSDIGKIISDKDFDKTESDDLIFREDHEKICLLIKSKTDEYCFTNLALIHLDGASAISKKKLLKRYPYKHYMISDVLLETAGTVDLDAEIKFKMGAIDFSIDIDKTQFTALLGLYKALFVIAEKYKTIQTELEVLDKTQMAIHHMFSLRQLSEQAILNLPDIINQTSKQVEDYYLQRKNEIRQYDFEPIFKKYIG